MKEVVQLKRVWFGGYDRKQVQTYLDELYLDMEKNYTQAMEKIQLLEKENSLLQEHFQQSNKPSTNLNLSETANMEQYLALADGVYPIFNEAGEEKLLKPQPVQLRVKEPKQLHLLKNQSPDIAQSSESLKKQIEALKSEQANMGISDEVGLESKNLKKNKQASSEKKAPAIDELSVAEMKELQQENTQLKAALDFANQLLKDLYQQAGTNH